MKLLTFLGVGKYEETEYVWGEHSRIARYAPAATCAFFNPLEALVFATQEAEDGHGAALHAALGISTRFVRVPQGKTSEELWKIFGRITENVITTDDVVFDITHGLRSFPLLGLLVAAFLQSARRANLRAVLYGAFDVRDQSVSPHRTPMFDLTPMLTLFEWTTATDQFVQTGDARRLAQLLGADASRKAAAQAAQKLSQVSLAAFLCQPFTLMREAQTLGAALDKAQPELAEQTLPFDVMREQITQTFGAFGADFNRDAAEGLRAQFRMIEWYYRNNQLIQAMTLAREWLISAVTLRLGQPINLGQEPRKEMEWAVSGLVRVDKMKTTDKETGERRLTRVSDLTQFAQTIYTNWVERDELIELWNLLSTPRNALDHAEHQADKMSLEKITRNADKMMPCLRALAVKWGFAEQDSQVSPA